MCAAQAFRYFATDQIIHGLVRQPGYLTVVQRHVNALPLARLPTFFKGGQKVESLVGLNPKKVYQSKIEGLKGG